MDLQSQSVSHVQDATKLQYKSHLLSQDRREYVCGPGTKESMLLAVSRAALLYEC